MPRDPGFSVTHARVFGIAAPAMVANLTTPLLGVVGTAVIGRLGQAHLLGAVAEETKLRLLGCADAFVLPSVTNAEAFGIVQVEAQMCGLPVVASNLPTGVSDVTVDGETGFLVPPGDIDALSGALGALLAGRLHSRVPATILIAIGAFFPAVSDSLVRFGFTGLHEIGLFLGVVFLFLGFLVSTEVFRELRVPFTSIRIALRHDGTATDARH